MAAVSYGRVRLTTSNDKYYRAHVEQFLLQRKNQRAMRPPRQRDIFGGQAEEALRNWLASTQTLDERRILEYEERRGKRGTMKYRELDAVIIKDSYPKQRVDVFEAKASRTARSLHRAIAQLQETRSILHKLYPTVSTTILLVNTGIPTAEEVAELMASDDPPKKQPQTLQEALDSVEDTLSVITTLDEANRDADRMGVMLFSVEDIIAMVGEENLALDWSDDDEPFDPADSPAPASSTFASSSSNDDNDDDDGGALAAALRQAGLG